MKDPQPGPGTPSYPHDDLAARQPNFGIEQVCHLSVATVALQAVTSLLLVRM